MNKKINCFISGETKNSLETVKQALDAADNILLFYIETLDEVGLKKIVDGLKSELSDSRPISVEDANLIGDITTKLMNGLDEWNFASQFISEAFGVANGLLPAYLKLFDHVHIDDRTSSAQKTLLLNMLNSVITSSNRAQAKLNETISEFKTVIEKSAELQAAYKNKSDEKSESINRVCDHLRIVLNQISLDIDYANKRLKDKTGIVEDLRSQIEKAAAMATTNTDATLQDAVNHSAQKLIADYAIFRARRNTAL